MNSLALELSRPLCRWEWPGEGSKYSKIRIVRPRCPNIATIASAAARFVTLSRGSAAVDGGKRAAGLKRLASSAAHSNGIKPAAVRRSSYLASLSVPMALKRTLAAGTSPGFGRTAATTANRVVSAQTVAAGGGHVAMGSSQPDWRSWSSIVGAVHQTGKAFSRHAAIFMSRLASARLAKPDGHGIDDPEPLEDELRQGRNWSKSDSVAALIFDSAGLDRVASSQRAWWPTTQSGANLSSLQRGTSVFANLTTPPVLAPTLASVPSRRQDGDGIGAGSIVINRLPLS